MIAMIPPRKQPKAAIDSTKQMTRKVQANSCKIDMLIRRARLSTLRRRQWRLVRRCVKDEEQYKLLKRRNNNLNIFFIGLFF
jgi:hypothetical protein